MLSDESSSDSETGRFKGRSEKQDQQGKSTRDKNCNSRPSKRNQPPESNKHGREIIKKTEEKDRFMRTPRERHRYSRYSPARRRHSKERSPDRRRSCDRQGHSHISNERSKPRDHRSCSRDGHRHSRSRSLKSADHRRSFKKEIKSNTIANQKISEQLLSSPELKGKRSEIHKPARKIYEKKRISPIVVHDKDSDSNVSEEVQLGSYYNIMPAVVKVKSDHSSEIDSSDDEKLRAKLLNLEKELHQAKRKKHKKKHRRKCKSVKEENSQNAVITVEVSSTTDIQEKVETYTSISQLEPVEVTSTQKNSQVESNEEGEILSDEDSQTYLDIDPTDLRHKLKRSSLKPETIDLTDLRDTMKSRADVCGPALPPHLKKYCENEASDTEGPVLPPHLQRTAGRILGPSIPAQMRQALAQSDCEIIQYESSDDDGIGPLPAGAEAKWSDAHQRLEERALDIKIRKMDGHSLQSSKIKSREQWMLELPEGKTKYLGLEARSFRAKEGPDMSDRSSWTDTPDAKARKIAGLQIEDPDEVIRREARDRQIVSRDTAQERAVKKHKKKHKRDESLLEMHEKKMKKKKKKEDKEDGKKERRPFSRDVDLQVNRFDEAQKKSIIKKAQQLDTRFSRGEAKFL